MSNAVTEAWRYEVKHGPDGEENYAWVLKGREMVATMRTHLAKEICAGMNAALSAGQAQPVAYTSQPQLERMAKDPGNNHIMWGEPLPHHADIPLYLHPPVPPAVPGEVEPHSDDLAVDRFAAAMKAKLAEKRAQGYHGWDDPEDCTIEHLSNLLVKHVGKGDPVDVGNFAMMIHQRGGRIE